MAKRRWVLVAFLVLAILGATGAGGAAYYLYGEYRAHEVFARAEKAYAGGLWSAAKNSYAWYLTRRPGDAAVLRKYIDTCTKPLDDRQGNLRDAGRAYIQLVLTNPSDRELGHEVIDFFTKFKLWRELAYASDLFLRRFPEDTPFKLGKALALDHMNQANEAIVAYQALMESQAASPEVYGNLAALLREQGLPEQGRQVLEKALEAQPKDHAIRTEYARFLLNLREFDRAAQEIETVLAAGNETAKSLLVAAQVHAARKDWSVARDLAEKSAAQSPSSEACFLLVSAFLAEHQTAKAISLLSGQDPYLLADNPELYLLLAEIQINSSLFDEARKTADNYRQAYPEERNVFEYLAAREMLQKGAAAEAVPKLETVVGQAPDFRMARFFLGLAYLETGQKERAKSTLELYLKNNPDDERARAVWNAAFAERSSEDIDAAARKLLDSDTAYAGSLMIAAYSLMKDTRGEGTPPERLELARALLERAIKASPTALEGYRDLTLLFIRQEKPEEAHKVLGRAEQAGLAPADLNLLRAALAIAAHKPDEASTCFRDEAARGGLAPQKALEWAGIFADMGHLETGLELLQTAAGQDKEEKNRQELDLGSISLCLRSGQLGQALQLLEQVAAKYPGSADVIHRLDGLRLAMARSFSAPGQRQDMASAERLLAEVEGNEPERLDAKTLRAALLLDKTPPDVDAAEALCAEVLRAGDPDAEVLLLSSEAATRKSQPAKALDFALKAGAAAPENPKVQLALARAQIQMDLHTDAIMTLEKLRSSQAEMPAALDLLARAYAGAERFPEAEAAAQRLEALAGRQAAEPLRAWLMVAREDWKPAAELLQKQYDANPDDLATIHLLAQALINGKQHEKAVELLNACSARRPEMPDLWVELGNVLLAGPGEGNLSEASAAFSRALVVQTGYSPALRGLLDVQIRSGNLGGALALCDRFLTLSPDDPDMLQQKALLLARIPDKRREALDVVERALQIVQRPESHYLRGSLLLDLGEFMPALEDFQRVVQARGVRSGELECRMAEAYLGLNDATLARFYYDSAKEKAARGERMDLARLDRIAARLEKEPNK